MFSFVELRKHPIQIGTSRGFLVDKHIMILESRKKYVILIIPEEFYKGGIEDEIRNICQGINSDVIRDREAQECSRGSDSVSHSNELGGV